MDRKEGRSLTKEVGIRKGVRNSGQRLSNYRRQASQSLRPTSRRKTWDPSRVEVDGVASPIERALGEVKSETGKAANPREPTGQKGRALEENGKVGLAANSS